jgi:hypothetical protein
MSRKSSITPALVLAGAVFAFVPTAAFAGSPLLSGYGGPGAGEQAILGSTLLNGSHGDGGSSGSSGSGGAGGADEVGSGTTSGSRVSTRPGAGSPSRAKAPGSASGSSGGSKSFKGVGSTSRSSAAGGSTGGRASGASTSVYPRSAASAASSSVIGMSSGDVLAFIAVIATLTLIGVFTVRLARLQP